MRAAAAIVVVVALALSGCLGEAASGDEPAITGATVSETPDASTPSSTPAPAPARPRDVASPEVTTTSVTTLVFDGHFDCAATYLIVAGDCFTIVDGAGSEAPVRPGDATEEAWVFPFRLNATWTRLDVTLITDAATPLSDGWMLVVEPAAWSGGHPPKFARAQGEAPLTITLLPGKAHPDATSDDVLQGGLGYQLVARAYPVGLAPDAADAGLLGVGLAADVEFTITVDIVDTTIHAPERDA